MTKCKCGGTEFFAEQKGHATGLYCSKCGQWQKWLAKNEIRLFEHNLLVTKQNTNADRIRNMSDEELARWLTKITDDTQLDSDTKCNYQWIEWLQSGVKESEEE